MKVEYLSNHVLEQLGEREREARTAATALSEVEREQRGAYVALAKAKRSKPWWRRLLRLGTRDVRAARRRLAAADQAVRRALGGVDKARVRVEQQAAGAEGEDLLARGLSGLSGDWVMLRGYRNKRGETDHLLVGPLGVWAVEVKRRAVRVHIKGEDWGFEKFDRYGNVVEKGIAADRTGRSWARQVTDVADDLGAWLRRNSVDVPIHTAVVIVHERAEVGRVIRPTVDVVETDPRRLLAEIKSRPRSLTDGQRSEVLRLIRRDHKHHEERRRNRRTR